MTLPLLYDRWAGEMLRYPLPEETPATCDDCAMCFGEGGFDPRIKCCTYIPDLPNFLVGGAILEGCPSIKARMESRSPLGLRRSPEEERIWNEVGQDFGLTPEVRCPHYDSEGGRCFIWPHRNAACATYFCRYERGPAWRGFWWILNRTLAEVERSLSEWCRDELDPEKEEYFVDCAGLVRDLSWSEVLRICGSTVESFAEQTREAQEGLLAQPVPDALRPGAYRVLRTERERSWIITEERLGPLRVPSDLLDILPQFEGRSAREVIREIPMDETILQHLVGYGLLVPAAP